MNKSIICISLVLLLNSIAIFSQQTVKLHGTCADSGFVKMSYSESSPFRWSEFNPDQFIQIPIKNAETDILYKTFVPKELLIYPPGYSHSQRIYVTPGDSVLFKTVPTGKKQQYSLQFFGKNAAHYNYSFFMTENALTKEKPQFKKGDDITTYKSKLSAWVQRKADTLACYAKINPVSDSFLRYAKADIQNEYIVDLYSPVERKLVLLKDIPSDYFSDAVIDKNNESHYYKVALAYKNIYYYTSDPISSFNVVKQHIKQSFTGDDLAYLWSVMVGYYASKQQQEYHSTLLQAIKEAPQYIQNSEYLNYVRHSEEYYTVINQLFPEDVLTKTFVRSFDSDKKISLKELLNLYEGKALYLDFWASWCSPCRYDIELSHPAKEYLSKKNVTWIYISKDDDVKAWLQAAKQDNITSNQYLLLDQKSSPLMTYLNVNYIPRYVIMNSQHKVMESTAPRPNSGYSDTPSSIHFDQLKNSINKVTGVSTITYY
jgi:Thiol-disulfide isomerase and thioredoxins